jgi:hypothetical protein
VNTLGKVTWGTLKLAGKGLISTTKATGKGIYFAGRSLYRNKEKIGGAVVGSAKGTWDIANGIRGNITTRRAIAKCLKKIDAQTTKYRLLREQCKDRLNSNLYNKQVLLDSLVVGGESLATYSLLGTPVDSSIQRAYELAYPNQAAEFTFAEQLDRLEGRELIGFTSGIKGKLFEQQYVNFLNEESLKKGFVAKMAESPTNAGWDVAVYGPDGNIDQLLQLKATDSVSYVKQAIEANPQIDVVTTSEVHSHLAMQGYADVIDSGISDETLTQAIEAGFESADLTMNWMPSIIALSIIAVSASRQKGLSNYGKSVRFGERAMKSYFAFIIGGAAAVATNTWWLAIIAGVSSRLLLGQGNRNLNRAHGLKKLIRRNERIIGLMEERYGYAC